MVDKATNLFRNRSKFAQWAALCSFVFLASSAFAQRPSAPSDLDIWLTGDPEDKVVELTEGPAVVLMGGGREPDPAFSDWAFPVANGGDIVVLRTSGSDGYNDYFFEDLIPSGPFKPNSVETIRLRSRTHADSDYVKWVIDTAEMVWFAGGDQSTYMEYWLGTETQAAVQRVYDRGGVVGGTSAGLAILGEFVFDPGDVSASNSEEAIENPYNTGITISDRFIDIPTLQNVITDTHFQNRDRMGRSLAFMARLRADDRADEVMGVAVSERSAIFVDKNGLGHFVGTQQAYILMERGDTEVTQVEAGEPLIYGPVDRLKLEPGDTFDFVTRRLTKRALPLSVDGTKSPALDPADPYIDFEGEPIQGSFMVIGSADATM